VEERRNTFLEQQQKLTTLAGQQRVKLQKVQQERETVESVVDQLLERAALVERRREQRSMDDMHGNQRTRKRIAEMSETRAARRLDVAC
jgi:flagellar biosynthesis chaperone FliJ